VFLAAFFTGKLALPLNLTYLDVREVIICYLGYVWQQLFKDFQVEFTEASASL
jgi:hypothetical protein